MVTLYLDALQKQATIVAEALGEASFAQMAIGGGTPTFLEVDELERLFRIITSITGVRQAGLPVSCEVSPKTVTLDKLQVLQSHDANPNKHWHPELSGTGKASC